MATKTHTVLTSIFKTLYGAAEPGTMIEIRPLGKGAPTSRLVAPDDPAIPNLNPAYNYYFGVCPRTSGGEVATATVVWCDIDDYKKHSPPGFDPMDITPRPTLVVSSGGSHKVHIYWALSAPTRDIGGQLDPMPAVRACQLARAAFGGDQAVCEPNRVMRLPGSMNHKYDPPRPCEVLQFNDITYDLSELEVSLMAAASVPLWQEGTRHEVALGLGAYLARAGWDKERAEQVVRELCQVTGDRELPDRLTAVLSTYDRHGSGQAVSAAGFKEAAGDTFKSLMGGLGITGRDGDIELDGVKIATDLTIQRDFVHYVLAKAEWAVAEGVAHYWDGSAWRPAEHKDALMAYVFTLLGRSKRIDHLAPVEYPATARLAGEMAKVIEGTLSSSPLPTPGKHLLPARNGILDLGTGELLPHDKAWGNRWVLPVEYDPAAECPRWLAYLAEAQPNPAHVLHLQDWAGYIFVPRNPYQRLLWVAGLQNTGKSTFITTIAELLGPAAVSIEPETIGKDPYSRAMLASALVAVCSEISNNLLRTSEIKKLVTADPTSARHPYGRPFKLKYEGKLIFGSNVLPQVDQGEGAFRRFDILPFDVEPAKSDPRLWETLHGPELPGILNWALTGYRRMAARIATGEAWERPTASTEIIAEYKDAADTYARFVAEEVELQPDDCDPAKIEEYEVPSNNLYVRYSEFCKRLNSYTVPFGPIFCREMRKHGLTPSTLPKRIHGRATRYWTGGRLVAVTFG